MKQPKVITSQKISQQILKSSAMDAFDILPYLRTIQEQSNSNFEELIKIIESTLFFMNGEEHLLFRKILAKPMSMQSMLTFQESMTKNVIEVLNTFTTLKEPDLLKDFSDPLFIKLVINTYGLKINDEAKFLQNISNAMFITEPMLSLRVLKKLQQSLIELKNMVKEQILDGTSNKGLINEINKNASSIVDDDQIYIILIILIISTRTVTESLVCMLRQVNDSKLQMQKMILSKGWLDNNIDHLIRFCASTKYLTRVANKEIKFGDIEILKGEQVFIDVMKANRDKNFYGEDISFENNPSTKHSHISFGGGSHTCTGLHFSKIVIPVAIVEFFKKIPKFTYNEDNIKYEMSAFAKRVQSCPISFTYNKD